MMIKDCNGCQPVEQHKSHHGPLVLALKIEKKYL
jgi:hypothetical protein